MFLQAKEHIQWLHGRSQGVLYYCWKRSESFYYKPYKHGTHIHEIDSYISVNSFQSNTTRMVKHLHQLNAVFVDLDFGILNANSKYVFAKVEEILPQKNIPLPNGIVFSGRGAHLYWLLLDAFRDDLPIWQEIQNALIDTFKDENADPKSKDASRILRLSGTINSKNPEEWTELKRLHDQPYDLQDLRTHFKPPRSSLEKPNKHQPTTAPKMPEGAKKSQKGYFTKGKVSRWHNQYAMHWARLQDIEKLVEMRKDSHTHITGNRELTLWIYRNSYKQFASHEEALEATLELNSKLSQPLSDNEATKATGSGSKVYTHSNVYIIRALEISPDEQRHMKILISRQEKYRRNNERRYKLTREQYLKQSQNLRSKVHELSECGHTSKEIAASLNISEKHTKRIMGAYVRDK